MDKLFRRSLEKFLKKEGKYNQKINMNCLDSLFQGGGGGVLVVRV